MHSITLTSGERRAIDFVGNRYWCGDNLFKLLMRGDFDNDWDSTEDATFELQPEDAAQLAFEFDEALQEGDIALLDREILVKLWDFTKEVLGS